MRHVIRAILIACLAFAAPAITNAQQGPIGAGDALGGWIALPYPDTRPASPDSKSPRPDLQQLYFLPADSPAGSLYGVQQLPSAPHSIAASGAKVILLFAPAPGDSPQRWTTRALTAIDQPDPLPPLFDPSGRLEVLPALRTDGAVAGFCGIPGGGAAALFQPVTDATGEPIGDAHQLRAIIGGQWRDVTLPEKLRRRDRCVLLPMPGGLAILAPNSTGATLWEGKFPSEIDRTEPILEPTWTSSAVSITTIEAPMLVTGSGHLISAQRQPDSALVLSLHLEDSTTPLATLRQVPEAFALTRVGDTVSLVYLSDAPTPRIQIAAVHASTGEILHQGPHVKVMPISPDDLRFLGFILALVLMTALVFVLRPSAASATEIALPPGTAMAGSERRLLAGIIDFGLPLVLVARLWDVGVFEVLIAPIRAEQPSEFWPFAVASVSYFLHTVMSEWLLKGRTLGKAVARIRVASINGKPLTFWQCISRNTIKLVCPPLLMIILVDPRRRHPGDTLAGAVVIAKAVGPPPPADDDSDDDDPGRTNEATIADG